MYELPWHVLITSGEKSSKKNCRVLLNSCWLEACPLPDLPLSRPACNPSSWDLSNRDERRHPGKVGLFSHILLLGWSSFGYVLEDDDYKDDCVSARTILAQEHAMQCVPLIWNKFVRRGFAPFSGEGGPRSGYYFISHTLFVILIHPTVLGTARLSVVKVVKNGAIPVWNPWCS